MLAVLQMVSLGRMLSRFQTDALDAAKHSMHRILEVNQMGSAPALDLSLVKDAPCATAWSTNHCLRVVSTMTLVVDHNHNMSVSMWLN